MTASASKDMRNAINHSLSAMELISSIHGYETAVEGLEELSDIKHNLGDHDSAEILRWAAMELRANNA